MEVETETWYYYTIKEYFSPILLGLKPKKILLALPFIVAFRNREKLKENVIINKEFLQ